MGTGVVLAPPAAAGSRSSEVLVADAAFPAALASLAGGGLRYGEHLTGRVREVDAAGQLLVAPVAEVAVRTGGQRGLLGLSVDGSDRTFATWVRMADGRIVVGQVAPGPTRLVWEGPESSRLANGGHLEFAPDGTLVVGIGDLQAGRLVDDPDRPNGKLLRLDPDGAPDQRPATISTGWNNPFAFTFTPSGALWVADNVGRRGRERLARGDRNGKPTAVTELRGTRAPSGLAPIDEDHLALCGFVSARLDRFDVSKPDRARVVQPALADDCGIGAVTLADGTIAYANPTSIRTIAPGATTNTASDTRAALTRPGARNLPVATPSSSLSAAPRASQQCSRRRVLAGRLLCSHVLFVDVMCEHGAERAVRGRRSCSQAGCSLPWPGTHQKRAAQRSRAPGRRGVRDVRSSVRGLPRPAKRRGTDDVRWLRGAREPSTRAGMQAVRSRDQGTHPEGGWRRATRQSRRARRSNVSRVSTGARSPVRRRADRRPRLRPERRRSRTIGPSFTAPAMLTCRVAAGTGPCRSLATTRACEAANVRLAQCDSVARCRSGRIGAKLFDATEPSGVL